MVGWREIKQQNGRIENGHPESFLMTCNHLHIDWLWGRAKMPQLAPRASWRFLKLEPQTGKYRRWNHTAKYNTWERAVKSLSSALLSRPTGAEWAAGLTRSTHQAPVYCGTRLPLHLLDVRGNNGVPSTEGTASIMTAPGRPAPQLNMSLIQMNGAASELIINPVQWGFRGHGVLT